MTSESAHERLRRRLRLPTRRQRYERETRANDPALLEAARLRRSPTWTKLRAVFLAEHPVCCDPLGDHPARVEIATEVHHIQPVRTHPHRVYDPTNLAPLCSMCHNRIEQRERRGEATAHLFTKGPEHGGA